MSDDLFTKENELPSNWIKWGIPGDHLTGTLIGVSERESQFNAGEIQKTYEILAEKGEFHNINEKKKAEEVATVINEGEVWNVGGKPALDGQMKRIKIGQKLGLKFMDEKPSKTKGYNPAKSIKVFTRGEMNETWLAEQDLV